VIDRNHLAVTRCFPDGNIDPHVIMAETFAEVIRDALPLLTADDLRRTPAGRALMAEGWDAACRKVIHMAWADSSDAKHLADEGNPYRTEAPSDAPEG